VAERAAAFSMGAADVLQAPAPQAAAVEGLQQQVAPALVQAVRRAAVEVEAEPAKQVVPVPVPVPVPAA
jgi:hypothetical protein